MKKQLHFITIILMLAGTFAGWAQTGKQQGKYYVVRDTVNGEATIGYYKSKAYYDELNAARNERIKNMEEEKLKAEEGLRKRLAVIVEKINAGEGTYADFNEQQKQAEKEKQGERVAQQLSFLIQYYDQKINFEKINTDFYQK